MRSRTRGPRTSLMRGGLFLGALLWASAGLSGCDDGDDGAQSPAPDSTILADAGQFDAQPPAEHDATVRNDQGLPEQDQGPPEQDQGLPPQEARGNSQALCAGCGEASSPRFHLKHSLKAHSTAPARSARYQLKPTTQTHAGDAQ